jgi:hypothetical protein
MFQPWSVRAQIVDAEWCMENQEMMSADGPWSLSIPLPTAPTRVQSVSAEASWSPVYRLSCDAQRSTDREVPSAARAQHVTASGTKMFAASNYVVL